MTNPVLLTRIASIIAFLVGAMSIVAGGKVIRGWEPGWSVIAWLPVYNFIMGILALIPAVLIWMNNRHAFVASAVTLGIHVTVLALLLVAFRNTVAFQSVGAMSFRIAAWAVVLALLWLRPR